MERQAVTGWPAAELREEDSLVSAARDGDRAAFARLYDRYARMVHGILVARVPPREVDDLIVSCLTPGGTPSVPRYLFVAHLRARLVAASPRAK